MAGDLERVIIIGAGMGLARQIADLLPGPPPPPKVITVEDRCRLERAERKRERRRERNARSAPQADGQSKQSAQQ